MGDLGRRLGNGHEDRVRAEEACPLLKIVPSRLQDSTRDEEFRISNSSDDQAMEYLPGDPRHGGECALSEHNVFSPSNNMLTKTNTALA